MGVMVVMGVIETHGSHGVNENWGERKQNAAAGSFGHLPSMLREVYETRSHGCCAHIKESQR